MDSAWWARRARSELPIPCDGPRIASSCICLSGLKELPESLKAGHSHDASIGQAGKRRLPRRHQFLCDHTLERGAAMCAMCTSCLRPQADACPATHARRGLQAHVPAKHRLEAVCEAGCSHDVPAEHKDVMPTQNFQSCVRGQGQTLKA